MKRFVVAVLVVLLAASPVAANEVSGKARELDAVKSRLKALQHEYRETRKERGDAASELAASERAISETTRALRELEARQSENQQALRGIESESDDLARRVREQQTQLSRSLRASHVRGDADALKILLGGGDPNQAARDLRYLAALSQAQARQVAALRADLAGLDRLRAEADAKHRSLAEIREARAAQQEKLEADRSERAATLARISKEVAAQRRQIANLQRDEKALTALVAKLNRILARRASERSQAQHAIEKSQAQRAIEKSQAQRASERSQAQRAMEKSQAQRERDKARSKTTTPRTATGKPDTARPVGVNTETPDATLTSSHFAQLKGALRLPVAGELMNRFGAPREGGGTNWKGLFIRAARGLPVKAIASGEVVFSEWMRGFGNLLVIDHGDGYMSLYSNNESLYKRVGDRVRPGDAIAAVGNSGGQPDPGLYFEMRHQSRPLNPMTWVK